MIDKFVPGKLYKLNRPVYFRDKLHPRGTIFMIISVLDFEYYTGNCYHLTVLIEDKIIERKNAFLDWFEQL